MSKTKKILFTKILFTMIMCSVIMFPIVANAASYKGLKYNVKANLAGSKRSSCK